MTDATKKAVIEIGTTLAAFAIEVWKKLIRSEEKKGGKQ